MSDLQISVNVVSDKETQLTVKVPVGNIQSKVESRIRSVAKTAKIDGFVRAKCQCHTFAHSMVLAFSKK